MSPSSFLDFEGLSEAGAETGVSFDLDGFSFSFGGGPGMEESGSGGLTSTTRMSRVDQRWLLSKGKI